MEKVGKVFFPFFLERKNDDEKKHIRKRRNVGRKMPELVGGVLAI